MAISTISTKPAATPRHATSRPAVVVRVDQFIARWKISVPYVLGSVAGVIILHAIDAAGR